MKRLSLRAAWWMWYLEQGKPGVAALVAQTGSE